MIGPATQPDAPGELPPRGSLDGSDPDRTPVSSTADDPGRHGTANRTIMNVMTAGMDGRGMAPGAPTSGEEQPP